MTIRYCSGHTYNLSVFFDGNMSQMYVFKTEQLLPLIIASIGDIAAFPYAVHCEKFRYGLSFDITLFVPFVCMIPDMDRHRCAYLRASVLILYYFRLAMSTMVRRVCNPQAETIIIYIQGVYTNQQFLDINL